MDVNINNAILVQNRAFVLRLNTRLSKPIPETLIKKQLESSDPFMVAKLVLRTYKELNKPEISKIKVRLTKFDRFIIWLKRLRRVASS